jgi:hypothetical protein
MLRFSCDACAADSNEGEERKKKKKEKNPQFPDKKFVLNLLVYLTLFSAT